MGKTFFLSKKQKAQMRERRKKKKTALQTTNPDNEEEEETHQGQEAEQEPSLKRPRTEDEAEPSASTARSAAAAAVDTSTVDAPAKTISITNKRPSIEYKTNLSPVDGKLYVIVPFEVTNKDAKKFRKDARRQLRLDGKADDSTILVFCNPDELPASARPNKKRKKEFPSIKELLHHKQQLQEAQKEEEKLNKKINDIPEELKSQYVALDCEMVGIGTDGKKSALARVSIVDWNMQVSLDTFVRVPIRVTDFRTHVSGVEPKHIKDKTAMDVEECRKKVTNLLKDKVLVGHALSNDFKALMLNHPKSKIRDTAKYRPFQRYSNSKWRPRKLRDLVKENLKGKEGFQSGEHDSVDDAKATMELFQLVRNAWEKELASKTK